MGSVEHIGIKSTRLRSLSGDQIIMSNADLLKGRVRNYGRMSERRVVFAIGVTYATPSAQLERIPGLIREIVHHPADSQGVRAPRDRIRVSNSKTHSGAGRPAPRPRKLRRDGPNLPRGFEYTVRRSRAAGISPIRAAVNVWLRYALEQE